ncbi:hypothetical protein [Streptomyces tsukubensis]|uniref:Secreted protein n=1 Tax=Streptomyces tsukubensis TaxID=83656 RepID=A0A1V4A2S8_9ACTN|nr:hypothetical protein [Streptomyces tsukubensis]OON73013.1 hypothetical protein B1H18_28060 [Streptomyces tsukubensis]QFR93996.1 hypothetical protein GBW32_14160 [Streptomyces tsukubensis]
MSTLPLALLLTTAAATVVSAAAAVSAAYGIRKQITSLRAELAAQALADRTGHTDRISVPAARTSETDTEAIRTAVAEALADERERELAEARAFWAAQESRDITDAPSLLSGLSGFGDDLFTPHQSELVGMEYAEGAEFADGLDEPEFAEAPEGPGTAEFPEDSPELAAARRRHPSHPDFVPSQPSPVSGGHDTTVLRLERLASARTALTDVRPGPLGTLDVYVFEDGTTLCMTPGHRETAELLADALRDGESPYLLGGSGVSGAFALTFSFGERTIYLLADRVIASV